MKVTTKIGSLLGDKLGQVHSIVPQATVYDAIAKMAEKGVGALLVIEGDALVGILSERDYTRRVILQGRSSKEARVGEIMTAQVLTTTPEESIEDAMRRMTERRIRHLPVIQDGRVVSVISLGDLVGWTLLEQEETIEHLTSYITGRY
jgi:CBS domain-containing protein